MSDAPRPPVLALIGDRYHNPDYIRVHFRRLFPLVGVQFDYTANYEWFTEEAAVGELLAGRRLFCVFRDGLVFPDGYIGPEAYSHYITNLMADPPSGAAGTWVTEGFGRGVEEFVRSGGSLFCFHNSLSVASFSPTFRRVAGGVYDGHPPERNWRVEVVAGGNPITAGVSSFVVTDEQHFPIYDGPEEAVLLRGVNTDGLFFTSDSGAVERGVESVVAWAHELGAGRVVACTLGHNLDALWKPDSMAFQVNALRWLLRVS